MCYHYFISNRGTIHFNYFVLDIAKKNYLITTWKV